MFGFFRIAPMGAFLTFASVAFAASPTTQPEALDVQPASLIAGSTRETTLKVFGLPPRCSLEGRVNVGALRALTRQGKHVTLRYQLPAGNYPQQAIFLLRCLPRRGQASLHRIVLPIAAYANIPVKTRPNSRVTLSLGDHLFGPTSSGPKGRVTLRVLVPPGISWGWARVVDDKGLETRRRIEVHQATYPRCVVALFPQKPPASWRGKTLSLALACASHVPRRPYLVLLLPNGTRRPIAIQTSSGIARGAYVLSSQAPAGLWRIQGGRGSEHGRVNFTLPALAPLASASQATSRQAPRAAPSRPGLAPARPWRVLGAGSVGLLSNFGQLLSPRFALGAGVDYALPWGRLGVDFESAVAWGRRDTTLETSSASVSTAIVLIPMTLRLRYELSFGRLATFVGAGPSLILLHLDQDGKASGTTRRTEPKLGLSLRVGARWRLGPGGVVASLGYTYSHVETPEVRLLAGGIIATIGYRLEWPVP